jgi:hypothetical protein
LIVGFKFVVFSIKKVSKNNNPTINNPLIYNLNTY